MTGTLKTIMCVDNEEDILDVVSMSLELLGDYTVVRCDSGRQALSEIDQGRPDLVLMDVMMPELDGPSTMRQMHRLPGKCDLPVIFMTAHVQPDKQRALLDMGAVACISKPFDSTTLVETIASIWSGLQTLADGPSPVPKPAT